MSDEFFDDEEELMAAASPAGDAEDAATTANGGKKEKRGQEKREPLRTASGRVAPPFWMVLLIAVLALLLGVVIGYLVGSSTALHSLESQQQQLESEAQASGSFEMPEGHPQVSVDEDGTAHLTDTGSTDADGSAAAGSAEE